MRRLVVAGMLLVTVSCVSIPREAPQLSGELGKRISALEAAHVSMLRTFMAHQRAQVDDFLIRDWVPRFSQELMQEPVIKSTWDQICASGTSEDRLHFLTTLGPALQGKINTKRLELVTPLDDFERSAEQRLRDEYAQSKAINNAITSFLAGAADVAADRDRYLNMLGVQDDLSAAFETVDKAVAQLVNIRSQAKHATAEIEKYSSEVAAARERLKSETAARANQSGPRTKKDTP